MVIAVKHYDTIYMVESLLCLLTNSLKSSLKKIELLPRLYRFWAYLQTFNIQYREGNRKAHRKEITEIHFLRETRLNIKRLLKSASN